MTTQLSTRLYRGGGRTAVTILAVALVAACGGGSGAQTSTRASAQTPPSAPSVPPTTAAAITKPCLQAAESTRTFRFKTSDGATLVGVVLGTGRTGLLLGHQLGSDLCEWLPQARAFARRGYRVLVFDFAGFGDSQPGTDGRVDTDVVAAAAELRRRGADRIVLVGSSMGGTAVLSAATRIRPPVAGVVSLSGPSGFGGVDAEAAMARLRVPVLFVVGADDQPYREPLGRRVAGGESIRRPAGSGPGGVTWKFCSKSAQATDDFQPLGAAIGADPSPFRDGDELPA